MSGQYYPADSEFAKIRAQEAAYWRRELTGTIPSIELLNDEVVLAIALAMGRRTAGRDPAVLEQIRRDIAILRERVSQIECKMAEGEYDQGKVGADGT